MLGQPRGGYGTISIAWRASMLRASRSLLPAAFFLVFFFVQNMGGYASPVS